MKKISVVIPMYYEEEVVKECYSRIKKVLIDLKKYGVDIYTTHPHRLFSGSLHLQIFSYVSMPVSTASETQKKHCV